MKDELVGDEPNRKEKIVQRFETIQKEYPPATHVAVCTILLLHPSFSKPRYLKLR
jgi:hypothetical protein